MKTLSTAIVITLVFGSIGVASSNSGTAPVLHSPYVEYVNCWAIVWQCQIETTGCSSGPGGGGALASASTTPPTWRSVIDAEGVRSLVSVPCLPGTPRIFTATMVSVVVPGGDVAHAHEVGTVGLAAQ